jgi:hypothetical protein
MKNTLHSILFLAVSLFFSEKAAAQGMIINEVSNGASGNREFVEFLVVGSAAAPTTPVNLSGWIIDDNNGDFGGSIAGVGISTGHIRISASCLASVPVGSLIVIYNVADKNTNITLDDDATDINNDGVYVFPSNSSCFQLCSNLPLSNSNPAYGACTYGATTTTTWGSVLGLGNTNDAFQVRRPDASFYHGLSYGAAITATFPSFPAELGGGTAFNSQFSTMLGQGIAANCGGFNVAATYEVIPAASETPGAGNNTDNSNMIENIRNGEYNYDDPNDPLNCVLPLYLLDFDARATGLQRNLLRWTLATVDPQSHANIQRSADGYNFKTIGKVNLEAIMDARTYTYSDFTPFQTTYYRLQFIEPNAKISYSHIRAVSHDEQESVLLFPNPAREQLHISLPSSFESSSQYMVVDALGRVLLRGEIAKGEAAATISTQELAAGTYFLQLQNEKTIISRTFIKM